MAKRRTKRQRAAKIARERRIRKIVYEQIEAHGVESVRGWHGYDRYINWLERYAWRPKSPFRLPLRRGIG